MRHCLAYELTSSFLSTGVPYVTVLCDVIPLIIPTLILFHGTFIHSHRHHMAFDSKISLVCCTINLSINQYLLLKQINESINKFKSEVNDEVSDVNKSRLGSHCSIQLQWRAFFPSIFKNNFILGWSLSTHSSLTFIFDIMTKCPLSQLMWKID